MKIKKFGKGNNSNLINNNRTLNAYFNDIKNCGDDLVTSNLRLVVSIANTYNGIMPLEDLIQEGSIGLIMASKTFDPSLGYTFSTHAVAWIRKYIVLAIEEKSRVVRRPHWQQDGIHCGVSIDAPMGDSDDGTMAENLVGYMGINSDLDSVSIEVERRLGVLTDREQKIVKLYYGIGTDVPMSYETIAIEVGLTTERVRQLHLGALKKMRS